MSMPTTELHVTTWGKPVLLIHGSLTYGDPAGDDWPKQWLRAFLSGASPERLSYGH